MITIFVGIIVLILIYQIFPHLGKTPNSDSTILPFLDNDLVGSEKDSIRKFDDWGDDNEIDSVGEYDDWDDDNDDSFEFDTQDQIDEFGDEHID